FRDERSTVQPCNVRNFKDFHLLKGGQIHSCYPRGIIPVDKQPSTIKDTVLLGKLDMVGIIPRDETIGGIENRFGFFIIPIAVFRKLGKYGNFLKHSARWDTVYRDLSAISSG